MLLYFSSEVVIRGYKDRKLCYSLYLIGKPHQHNETKEASQTSFYTFLLPLTKQMSLRTLSVNFDTF